MGAESRQHDLQNLKGLDADTSTAAAGHQPVPKVIADSTQEGDEANTADNVDLQAILEKE